MNKQLSCFKALDIRGQINKEIDEKLCYKIARAYAIFIKPKSVVIGGDARLTTKNFKKAVITGLLDEGVDVIDLGLIGTEEIYFATSFLQADGGIMVTASHNPIDYNGLKLVKKNSVPIDKNTGLLEIKNILLNNDLSSHDVTKQTKGKIIENTVVFDEYINKLLSFIDFKNFIHPLKILVNSGNGVAGHVIDALEKQFKLLNIPISIIKMFHKADGNFPNGIPNPLLIENRHATADAVIQNQADLGIAFDGDFDRCFLFDNTGLFIDGYYVVGMLTQAFLQKQPKSNIVFEPRLVWNTMDIINNFKGIAQISPSGHSFIKQKMRATDAIYGGEISAHHYFKDFYYCDSGMISWLLIAEILSYTGKSLSFFVKERMRLFPASNEINYHVNDPDEIIQRIANLYQDQALFIDHLDGMSMEFADWRFNIRMGNTEPVLRLNIETRSDIELLNKKIAELDTIIKRDIPL